MKTSLAEVSGNRRDIALSPAPPVNVWLSNKNEPNRNSQNPYGHQQFANSIGTQCCLGILSGFAQQFASH